MVEFVVRRILSGVGSLKVNKSVVLMLHLITLVGIRKNNGRIKLEIYINLI